jgi:general secretion pathway protein A
MYTAFHNLAKKPFSMTADPTFLFVTRQHREALVGLTSAVLDRRGVLVLSGIAGSGKTTLLSWVLQRLACDKVRTSVIFNPTLTRDEFLEMVMLDFGIANIPASKAQRLWTLQNYLVAGIKEGKINVLVIDEAHKLSYEVLEEIRLLGNLECGDEKMLQILLLGQSELDEVMARPELWQFKQRISTRLTIDSLAPNEVEPYIQHRWNVAGGQGHPFSAEGLDRIRRYSKGIPRLINALCDNALTEAFADESRVVKESHVDAAAVHLLLIEKPKVPAPTPALAPGPRNVAPAPKAAAQPAPPSPVPTLAKPASALPSSAAAGAPAPAAPPATVLAASATPLNGTASSNGSVKLLTAGIHKRPKRWFFVRWADKLIGNDNRL